MGNISSKELDVRKAQSACLPTGVLDLSLGMIHAQSAGDTIAQNEQLRPGTTTDVNDRGSIRYPVPDALTDGDQYRVDYGAIDPAVKVGVSLGCYWSSP